jgi:hypothetical protein
MPAKGCVVKASITYVNISTAVLHAKMCLFMLLCMLMVAAAADVTKNMVAAILRLLLLTLLLVLLPLLLPTLCCGLAGSVHPSPLLLQRCWPRRTEAEVRMSLLVPPAMVSQQ